MAESPQHGPGAAVDIELAVDRADVGLDGIRAQVGQPRHVGIALALGDQRENLRLALAESLAATGPVLSGSAACPAAGLADHHLAGVYGLQCRDQFSRGQGLGEVAVGTVPSRTFHQLGVKSARRHGAHGYLSKTLPARELVAALESVHSGEVVVSEAGGRARGAPGQDWPGRGEGLSEREAEILALITQGKSNADVARLTYLSPNTVKSYIRTIYRKLDVDSRTRPVLWGLRHGFTPDHHRIEHWRGGP